MGTLARALFERYSPASDLTVIAVCFVMVILMLFSYVSRGRSLRLFLCVIGTVVLAAMVNVSWHSIIHWDKAPLFSVAYGLRVAYHALLFFVFCLYARYITEVTGAGEKIRRQVERLCGVLWIGLVAADILTTLAPSGFRVLPDGDIQHGIDVFLIGYLAYTFCIVHLLYRVRNYLYRKVMFGFYGSIAIAYLMQVIQQFFRQSSFTVATFMFPLIAMLYIMHSTPYNASLGAVDARAMHDMVSYLHARRRPFIFLSCYLPGLDNEGSILPEGVRSVVRRLATDYFRGACLFQIHSGHIVLLFQKQRNPDYEHRIRDALSALRRERRQFHYDYKIVIGESIDSISQRNEYASLIDSIHRAMKDNTVHHVMPEDIEAYDRDLYIISQLSDIYQKKDLEDPRVMAYCQPVYSIASGRFETAEALMRLNLEKTGLVMPDDFIPLAEEYGYIHVLTEIILHKACQAIRSLTARGYAVGRISVNVSALELRDNAFCGDISRVIRNTGIPLDRIAIELTESRNEEDFLLAKRKIEELRSQGIQLYLDDFGTGYTNLERIVELPFDTIKFDRSMVMASGTDSRAEQLLESLAATLAGMGYSILFEGVETESDERRCREMSATYLQGFKYSRPVPIDTLNDFFPKAG